MKTYGSETSTKSNIYGIASPRGETATTLYRHHAEVQNVRRKPPALFFSALASGRRMLYCREILVIRSKF